MIEANCAGWSQSEALGEHISELVISGNSLETEMSYLCSFVREVLTNVDMLRTLSAIDHIVSPLNACRVVLIHRLRGSGSESHITYGSS